MYRFVKLQQFLRPGVHEYWKLTKEDPKKVCDSCERILEAVELDLGAVELDKAEQWMNVLVSLNAVDGDDSVFGFLADIFGQGHKSGRKSLATQITNEAGIQPRYPREDLDPELEQEIDKALGEVSG